jgi:predicted RND superfamily exporter protein
LYFSFTNKYQQEYSAHGKARALQRVITVGTATLMTNLTTAAGFATFIITSSDILKEFGIISSLSIGIIFLCLIVIPFITVINLYPKAKHLEHLNRNYTKTFITWIENGKTQPSLCVCSCCVFVLVSTIGAFKIKTLVI